MSSRPSLSALRLVCLAVLLGIGDLAGASFALPADGDLDLRYGVGGVARSPELDRNVYEFPLAMACGPTGFCSLGAGAYVPDLDFQGMNFTSNGTYAAEFTIHFDLGGSLFDQVYATAIQRDGKVIQVGSSTDSAIPGNSVQAAIARYTTSLVPDPSFSANGKDNTNFVGDARSYAVAIAPDDKIVVAGCYWTDSSAGSDIFVLRYTTAGILDSTFDGDGIRIFGLDLGGSNYDCAYAVLVQSDGKIVLAGSVEFAVNDQDFTIVRLLPDGTFDPTFSDNLSGNGRSRVAFDLGGGYEDAYSVALDARGRIVVGGRAEDSDDHFRSAIARLLPNGTLDEVPGSFGSGGRYAPADSRGEILGIAVAGPPSNHIYYFTRPGWIGALTGSGALDTGFNGDGFVYFDDAVPNPDSQIPRALAFSGGMLHIGGASIVGADDYNIVARYWMHQIFGDGFEAGNTGAWLGW